MAKQLVKRPRNWESVLIAARVLMFNRDVTNAQAAEMAGVSVRSLQSWIASPVWREAEMEVARKWAGEARGLAMQATLDLLAQGDGPTVRYVLDKMGLSSLNEQTHRPVEMRVRVGDSVITVTCDGAEGAFEFLEKVRAMQTTQSETNEVVFDMELIDDGPTLSDGSNGNGNGSGNGHEPGEMQ